MPYPGPDMDASDVSPIRRRPRRSRSRRARRVPACNALPRPVRSVRPGARELRQPRALPDRSTTLGRPIDAHTTLPAALGGDAVANARRARAGAGDESRLHELHGEGAAAVRDGRSRPPPSRCRCPPQQAGLRDRRRRPAVPERRRQDVHRSRARDGGHARVRAPEGGALISYRFRRRAFLTALSGGVGLKIMLRNLEGSAQGMRSPGRLLVTHWPVGIVAGPATRCGSRRRAAWAAPRRSSRSPIRVSGPT